MIEIDGSHGEGGGQVVRTATSLAAVSGKPCHIFNIRAGRERPGLMRQHLCGIRALRELTGGTLDGDEIGSREITFAPSPIRADNLNVAIETAGSITLVMQSLLPAALFAPSPLNIIFSGGATDTSASPTFDYFRFVFLWLLAKMGVIGSVALTRRGYYPPGGAQVEVSIACGRPRPIAILNPGSIKHIRVVSSASELLARRRVAERQAEAARSLINDLGATVEVKTEYNQSLSPGSACCIIADCEHSIIGADAIGRLGKRAEEVGAQAASALRAELATGASLDRHMADQLLPYLALCGDECRVTVSEITRHAETNMWVVEQFLSGRFEASGRLIRWVAGEQSLVGEGGGQPHDSHLSKGFPC